MPRNRLVKLDHKPLLILALGALIVMVLVWRAVRPPDFAENEDTGQTMAILKWSSGEPKRKGLDAVQWDAINPGQEILDGDLIYTDQGTGIRLDALGGLAAEWSERTLAQIQRVGVPGPDPIRLLLNSGELFLRLQDQQQVQLAVFDGHFYTIRAVGLTQITWRRAQVNSEFSDVTVASGRLLTGAGSLIEIGAGETLRIPRLSSASQTLQVIKDDLALLSPASGLRIWVDPDSKLRISWRRPSGSPDDLVVIAARDRDMTSPLGSWPLPVDQTAVEVPARSLLVGPVFFQIRAQSNSSIQTAPQLTFLYPDVPATLDSPAPDAKVEFNTSAGAKAGQVDFRWSDQVGSTFWTLQLARDSEFKELVKEANGVLTPSTSIQELGAGEYHWRVLGYHLDRREPIWSRASRFTVQPVESRIEGSPVASATPSTSPTPEEAGEFVPEIQEAKPELADTRHSAPNLTALNDPVLPVGAKEPVPVELKWSASKPAPAGYEVQWSNNRNFAPVRSFFTRETKFVIRIRQPGQYFARVRAVDAAFQPLSEFSRIRRTTTRTPKARTETQRAQTTSRPAEPEVWKPLKPELNGLLVVNEVSKPEFDFVWTSPSSAVAGWYQLEIARDADFSDIVFKGSSASETLTVRTPLPEGRLYWRVRKGIRGSWSPSWRFEILTE